MKIYRSYYTITNPFYKDKGIAFVMIGNEPYKESTEHINKFSVGKCYIKATTPRDLTKEQLHELLHFIDCLVEDGKDISALIIHGTHSFLSSELSAAIEHYLRHIKKMDNNPIYYHENSEKQVKEQYFAWTKEYIDSKTVL